MSFAPTYSEIARHFHSNPQLGVKVGKIDTTVQKALGQRFDLQAYPSFFLISGSSVYEYDDARSKASFIKFATTGYKQQAVRPGWQDLAHAEPGTPCRTLHTQTFLLFLLLHFLSESLSPSTHLPWDHWEGYRDFLFGAAWRWWAFSAGYRMCQACRRFWLDVYCAVWQFSGACFQWSFWLLSLHPVISPTETNRGTRKETL